MSEEQQPIRSRRELRRARDAAQALQQASSEGQASAEATASAEAREQEKPETHARPGQAAPRVPVTPPVPPKAPVTSQQGSPGVGKPVAETNAVLKPNAVAEPEGRAAARNRIRRAADAPVDAVASQTQAERSSQIRARDRAALRTIKELADKEEQLAGNGPPTRRQLRLQQLREEVAPATARVPIVDVAPKGGAATPPPAAPAPATPNGAGAEPVSPKVPGANQAGPKPAGGLGNPQTPPGMTVEQALAARELIAAQAQNQLAKMEHIAAQDPEAVDPDILAEQIAVAERAAVLNKRAQAKQKLADQSVRPQPGNPGPTTANNLAMVTPLEFVKVPGVERPVMKPPSTSFVPVATGPKAGPRKSGGFKTGGAKSGKGGAGTRPERSGRAGVLARAEAAAKAASQSRFPSAASPSAQQGHSAPSVPPETGDDFAELPRVSASSAYGLEPLDAATAGLGRAQRHRLIQLGILAAGIVALIAGVAMIISGLAR